MVLSWMIYFSLLRHVCLLGERIRWIIWSHHQILFGTPWIDYHSCILHHRVRSPTNWLPSAVHASSTIKSYLEPHELIAIHASSTIESRAPWIDCLVLFMNPPPSNLIRSPMNWLPFMHPPPSSPEPHELIAWRCSCILRHLIRSPMNWLSFMHPPLSSTEPPVGGKYNFFVIFPIGSFTKHVYTYILCYFCLFVCFVLYCAEKEEEEAGVTYFKSFWVGTIVIKIN